MNNVCLFSLETLASTLPRPKATRNDSERRAFCQVAMMDETLKYFGDVGKILESFHREMPAGYRNTSISTAT